MKKLRNLRPVWQLLPAVPFRALLETNCGNLKMNAKKRAVLLVLMVASLAAANAHAHAKIETAQPGADSVQVAPKEIRLHFNEMLEPAFSKIELVDAQSAVVTLPKAIVDKEQVMVMHVPLPPLHTGLYRVRWTAMTHDGHKVKGEYAFKVQ